LLKGCTVNVDTCDLDGDEYGDMDEVGVTLGDLLQVGTAFDPLTVVLLMLVFVTADGEVLMMGHRGKTAATPSLSDLSYAMLVVAMSMEIPTDKGSMMACQWATYCC